MADCQGPGNMATIRDDLLLAVCHLLAVGISLFLFLDGSPLCKISFLKCNLVASKSKKAVLRECMVWTVRRKSKMLRNLCGAAKQLTHNKAVQFEYKIVDWTPLNPNPESHSLNFLLFLILDSTRNQPADGNRFPSPILLLLAFSRYEHDDEVSSSNLIFYIRILVYFSIFVRILQISMWNLGGWRRSVHPAAGCIFMHSSRIKMNILFDLNPQAGSLVNSATRKAFLSAQSPA